MMPIASSVGESVTNASGGAGHAGHLPSGPVGLAALLGVVVPAGQALPARPTSGGIGLAQTAAGRLPQSALDPGAFGKLWSATLAAQSPPVQPQPVQPVTASFLNDSAAPSGLKANLAPAQLPASASSPGLSESSSAQPAPSASGTLPGILSPQPTQPALPHLGSLASLAAETVAPASLLSQPSSRPIDAGARSHRASLKPAAEKPPSASGGQPLLPALATPVAPVPIPAPIVAPVAVPVVAPATSPLSVPDPTSLPLSALVASATPAEISPGASSAFSAGAALAVLPATGLPAQNAQAGRPTAGTTPWPAGVLANASTSPLSGPLAALPASGADGFLLAKGIASVPFSEIGKLLPGSAASQPGTLQAGVAAGPASASRAPASPASATPASSGTTVSILPANHIPVAGPTAFVAPSDPNQSSISPASGPAGSFAPRGMVASSSVSGSLVSSSGSSARGAVPVVSRPATWASQARVDGGNPSGALASNPASNLYGSPAVNPIPDPAQNPLTGSASEGNSALMGIAAAPDAMLAGGVNSANSMQPAGVVIGANPVASGLVGSGLVGSGSAGSGTLLFGAMPTGSPAARPGGASLPSERGFEGVNGASPAMLLHGMSAGSPASGGLVSGRAASTPIQSSNPFQAMDNASASASSRPGDLAGVAAARAQGISVGYQDPTLGYVELRAHQAAGAVHASLATSSTAAGHLLESQLGSMGNWLRERQTPVESLSVLAQGAERGFSGSASGSSGGNAGQPPPQSRAESAPLVALAGAGAQGDWARTPTVQTVLPVAADSGAAGGSIHSGSRISVLA